MNKQLMLFLLLAASLTVTAQTDTLKVDTTMQLDGVTVTGARIINKVDRMVVLPTKTMVKHSADGYDLLKHISIAGVQVNTAEQTISSTRGGSVQVRINDVKAEAQDILSLRPDEVVRVEYIENPSVRYSEDGLDAVINYIVKRRYSGYVGGVHTLQAFWERFNNSSAYFKYNYKKSEFSVAYRLSHRWYDEQKNNTSASYIQPDGIVRQRNYVGFNNTMTYTDNNLQFGYNLAEPDKYTLNVRFNYAWTNQPYYGPTHLIEETGKADLLTRNRNSSFSKLPSLDVYYSINLPHQQTLALNAVGTYIGTDYTHSQKEYIYAGSLDETLKTTPQNDYSYSTDGKKYSFIGEGIYTKQFEKVGFSVGTNYSISRTDNVYTGAVNTNTVLNSHNLYLFAQLQGKFSVINYQVGVGANYAAIHQGDIGFNKWTFRPQLSLSTNAIKNISIRYMGKIYQHLPSLSQLSDVRQQSNDMDVKDGNTGLVPYNSYKNSLSLTWTRPLFDLQLSGFLFYAPDIIMESIVPEQNADGTWLYSWKPMNQKSLTQQYAQAQFTFHAVKDVLDVTLYGVYSHKDSRGLDYRHKLAHWFYGVYTNLMLGNWNVGYTFVPAGKDLFGEEISGGEHMSNLEVSYTHKDFKFGLYWLLLGYAQGFDYTSETNSRYYTSSSHQTIRNNGNMLCFTFSWNFSHGRTYKSAQRRLDNSDRESGVR